MRRRRPLRGIVALALLALAVVAAGHAAEPAASTVWIPMVEKGFFGGSREVKLEATLYQPPGPGPFPLLLFNHGSTGGGRISPTLTIRYAAIAEFFVERGFAVLVPMRRGRGASGGDYGERYGCNPATHAAGVERGIADVEAALAFALAQPWADRSKLVLGGMSRGGFLSVVYPSVRSVEARGVINFAGGWTPDTCDPAGRFNQDGFARAGRGTLPTLWLYAENDRNYRPTAIRAYHRAFADAGGAGKLELFPPIGHDGHELIPRSVEVWRQAVDDFLTRLGLGRP